MWRIATSFGSDTTALAASQSDWQAEPQKPSTPWVAESVTSSFGASAAPCSATSVKSGSPSGPEFGLR